MVALLAVSGTWASQSLMGTAWVYCCKATWCRDQYIIQEVEIQEAWNSSFSGTFFLARSWSQEGVKRSWSQTKRSHSRGCALHWGAGCLHTDLNEMIRGEGWEKAMPRNSGNFGPQHDVGPGGGKALLRVQIFFLLFFKTSCVSVYIHTHP